MDTPCICHLLHGSQGSRLAANMLRGDYVAQTAVYALHRSRILVMHTGIARGDDTRHLKLADMLAPRPLHLKGTEARVGVKDVTQVCYTFTIQMKECKISAVSGCDYLCHNFKEYPILCPRCSFIC
jgi:hypothetical protein